MLGGGGGISHELFLGRKCLPKANTAIHQLQLQRVAKKYAEIQSIHMHLYAVKDFSKPDATCEIVNWICCYNCLKKTLQNGKQIH